MTAFLGDEREHSYADIEHNKRPHARGNKVYPDNLLEAIMPGQTEYPEDIEKRIAVVLESTKVFTERYRRDADCIRSFFKDGLTLQELGDLYGITRERIRQLLARAIKKMRRAVVLSFLRGENDTFFNSGIEKSEKIDIENYNTKIDSGLYSDLPIASEESISISMLARSLSKRTTSINACKVRYADISSWLIKGGYLETYEKDGKTIAVPTEQGVNQGIKRGRRINSQGVEYNGVFLEKEAQIFIEEHLGDIIEFITNSPDTE